MRNEKAYKYRYAIAAGVTLFVILLALLIFFLVFHKPNNDIPTPTPTQIDIPPIQPTSSLPLNIDMGGVSARDVYVFGNYGVMFGANAVRDNFQTTLPSSTRDIPLSSQLSRYDTDHFAIVVDSQINVFHANTTNGQIENLTVLPAINIGNYAAGSFHNKPVIVSLVNAVQSMEFIGYDFDGNLLPNFDFSPQPSASSLFLPLCVSSGQTSLKTCLVDASQRLMFLGDYTTAQTTKIVVLPQQPLDVAMGGNTIVVISQRSIFIYTTSLKQMDMNFAMRRVSVSDDGTRFAITTDETSVIIGNVSGQLYMYQPSLRDTNGPVGCMHESNQISVVVCDSRVGSVLAHFSE